MSSYRSNWSSPGVALLVWVAVLFAPLWASAGSRDGEGELLMAIGVAPGATELELKGNVLSLKNSAIEVVYEFTTEGIFLRKISDRLAGKEIVFAGESGQLRVALKDRGSEVMVLPMKPSGQLQVEFIRVDSQALRQADRFGGNAVTLSIKVPEAELSGEFRVELRDGSHYVRLSVSLTGAGGNLDLGDLMWWELPGEGAAVIGTVHGSPVVWGNLFFMVEHPMSQHVLAEGRLVSQVPLIYVPEPDAPIERHAAIGVTPSGQVRRGFLAYVERERPRPYCPFVNYNSWWDISWGDRKMNEEECLRVIESFGKELVENYGVGIDAFVMDDGWDDNRTLWQFHEGFPRGFTPLRHKAEACEGRLGVWLSPFGGYGEAKKQRLLFGQQEGFEINPRGFSLAGPRYFGRFSEVCFRMIREFDCSYFKFDGIGEGSHVAGASREFGPDIEALLYLTRQLRREKPGVFLSITTGTWPSPGWLFFGDSVWRGGADWAAHGEGSTRQQWITYRDMEVYRRIVRRAPLYPLNSLMTVTVCFGQLGTALQMGREPEDVIDEIWMAAGSGTQNFELYLTPQLMNDRLWSVLAEALRWLRDHRRVLVDVHWVGGDPGQLEPYGYAAWAPEKAVLTVRNPSQKPQTLRLRLEDVWEVPPDFRPKGWCLRPRFVSRSCSLPEVVNLGQELEISLPAFGVIVVEGNILHQN
jgi:hypothetical protein